ncbi:conserved hypothetical protein [Deferribacter desulfuricans SSM1]|uniref:Uncharacterized protein n=1 Tax=Deferribacter desulfuricans (strain DSM 14783 / JCM 11476 / NBRC 101012 / SSM1) TaxID=639282 RepID=D3PEB7_DEFDS|nr:hypothetical protein [Deferribacter desulfuricans]BAI80940.1 conserved hypothetical protein [Deferribacter desulfuricans SSM1]
MIYRYDKRVFLLLITLLISAIYFAVSHFFIGGSPYKFIILGVLLVFILFNIISLVRKEIKLDDNKITVRALLGEKSLDFKDINDAVFLYLKGRTILILSDDQKFVFLSSLIDRFDNILDYIKDKVNEDTKKRLNEFDLKKYKKAKLFLNIFLVMAILFLLLFGTYNFLLLTK